MPGSSLWQMMVYKLREKVSFVRAALVAALFLGLTSFSPRPGKTSGRVKVIVIDAGHGGIDAGAAGVYSKEKDISLKVAMALGRAIEEEMPDVKVVYTRTTDLLVDLYKRIGLANRVNADLFLSIHCNSLPAKLAGRTRYNGVETLLSGSGRLGEQDAAIRENASMFLEKDYKKNYSEASTDPTDAILMGMKKNSNRRLSFSLATQFQNQFRQAGRIDRGIREQSLAVLARAGMPAALCEIGYICANQDEDYMNSEFGQRQIVSCLVAGIKAYSLEGDQSSID